jgi:acetyl esterase/lipase
MRPSLRAAGRLALVALVAAVPACSLTDVPLWGPACPAPSGAWEVESVRNIAYYSGPGADDSRHRLDLFLPMGRRGYPVVVLVHGGAWMFGDKSCCGLYSAVGQFFASQGVGVALPNYRLSPGVKHPEHVKDVARALAWTKAHVAEYGGDPGRLFFAGHSAGGHLVSLLATDESYLKAEGLTTDDVKGVIAVSGIYRIPVGNFDTTLGGATPLAFRIDEVIPLRGQGDDPAGKPWVEAGLPLSVNMFGPVFGDDARVRADASPVSHVRPGLPPFLLLSAESDLPTLPDMAEEFRDRLREEGNDVCHLTIRGRNHNSVMFRAIETRDPVAAVMLEFIRAHDRRLP